MQEQKADLLIREFATLSLQLAQHHTTQNQLMRELIEVLRMLAEEMRDLRAEVVAAAEYYAAVTTPSSTTPPK